MIAAPASAADAAEDEVSAVCWSRFEAKMTKSDLCGTYAAHGVRSRCRCAGKHSSFSVLTSRRESVVLLVYKCAAAVASAARCIAVLGAPPDIDSTGMVVYSNHGRLIHRVFCIYLQLTGRRRPGVSQFSQPHLLLKRGMVELTDLFGVDMEQTLVEAGGVSINWIEDALVVSPD